MSNLGRVNLVTRFCCATCGNQLELSSSVNREKQQSSRDYLNDNITGADKVEVNIWIEPCKKCIGVPIKQLETLKEILKS